MIDLLWLLAEVKSGWWIIARPEWRRIGRANRRLIKLLWQLQWIGCKRPLM
jgi:hypothetical protein